MNEGVFPKTSSPDTFIPYNLRKGHGLPAIENRDAISAYYFYRMINRTQEINLIYSTDKTGISEGDQSRFLQQLYYEYPGEVRIENVFQSPKLQKVIPIFASKDKNVFKEMEKWENQDLALSPSSLSVYIECPLQFYFKYVANIREPEEIDEDLNFRTFGNMFHQIIEALYRPFVGKTVTASDLKSLLADENKIIKNVNYVFEKNIPFVKQVSDTFIDLQGKNSLVYEIIIKYTKKFLKIEIENTPFTLLDLEKRVSIPVTLSSGKKINIGGIIDRIDEKDNFIRIIDYKTGKSEQIVNSIDNLFDTKQHYKCKAIFQTLVYAYIQSHTYLNQDIKPGIISVRKFFGDSFSYDITLKEDRSVSNIITYNFVKDQFIEKFHFLIEEIFSPETQFTQTKNQDACKWCVFAEHCGKK
jgi:hypothetical protein